jgi:membrane fusion protein, multidrug efflux system
MTVRRDGQVGQLALGIMITSLMAVTQLPVHAQAATPAGAAADKEGRIRTQLNARNSVTIAAEIPARVATLRLREGDAFRAGELLVGLDCSLHQSQQRKAEAAVEAASAVVTSNQRMAELNAIGALEAQQGQARLKEASPLRLLAAWPSAMSPLTSSSRLAIRCWTSSTPASWRFR